MAAFFNGNLFSLVDRGVMKKRNTFTDSSLPSERLSSSPGRGGTHASTTAVALERQPLRSNGSRGARTAAVALERPPFFSIGPESA